LLRKVTLDGYFEEQRCTQPGANWGDAGNWLLGAAPNGPDTVVVFPQLTGVVREYNNNQIINLNVPITLGTLSVVNSAPAYGDAHNSEYLITANGGSLTNRACPSTSWTILLHACR